MGSKKKKNKKTKTRPKPRKLRTKKDKETTPKKTQYLKVHQANLNQTKKQKNQPLQPLELDDPEKPTKVLSQLKTTRIVFMDQIPLAKIYYFLFNLRRR